jgi:hypothetical protein
VQEIRTNHGCTITSTNPEQALRRINDEPVKASAPKHFTTEGDMRMAISTRDSVLRLTS